MSIQRIEMGLHLNHTNPVQIIYGDVDDSFINESLRFLNINQALHELLFSQGFERVIFFNNIHNVFFLDRQSQELFLNPNDKAACINRHRKQKVPLEDFESTTKNNNKTEKSKIDSLFGGGPLDDIESLNVLTQAGNENANVTNEEVANNNIVEYNNLFFYNTINDDDAIRLVDSALHDHNIKTAFIIDGFSIGMVNAYQLNTYIYKWSQLKSYEQNNNNKCFFILSEKFVNIQNNGVSSHSNYATYPVIDSLIKSEQCIKRISKPKRDELERILQRYRLLHNKQLDWKEAKSILLVMQALQLPLHEWRSYFDSNTMVDIDFATFSQLAARKDNRLKVKDFNDKGKSPKQELEEMIGMDNLKNAIESMIIDYNSPIQQNLRRHIVFRGNPGTGKTVSARIISRILQQEGILSSGHLIEADGSHLIGQYVGETRAKVNDLCNNALGGVLFIDEAYSLTEDRESSGSGSFAKEAVDTLLKRMEDDRDDLIVIMAGYHDDMEKFIAMNDGFESRIRYYINFEDYEPEELYRIADKFHIQPSGLTFTNEMTLGIKNIFKYLYDTRQKKFGNARMVENMMSEIFSNHNRYCYQRGIKNLDIKNIPVDINSLPNQYRDFANPSYSEELLEKSMQNLNEMIGLHGVKRSIDKMVKSVQAKRIRAEKIGSDENIYAGHFLFKGNTGTGKTTVAREFGNILKSLGMLKKGHVVEVQGEDLVAGFRGQTNTHAEKIIKSALDGVLFIDEAYGLAGSPNDDSDFFKSAQNKLLKLMEDNNHRLVVIAAGYPKDLDRFIASNNGFARRFNNEILFEDYSTDELLEMVKLFADRIKYRINEDALPEISNYLGYIKNQSNSSQFGNGGEARKVWNLLRSFLDERILDMDPDDHTPDVLTTITKKETAKLSILNKHRNMPPAVNSV